MIVIKLCGGLGNQLFQYSAGYSLARKHDVELFLDLHELEKDPIREYVLHDLSCTGIVANSKCISSVTKVPVNSFGDVVEKILSKLHLKYYFNYYKESGFEFEPSFFEVADNMYLDGYWQSEKYFSMYRDELLAQFQINKDLSNSAKTLAKEIEKSERVLVSVHVRRGDYVSNAKANVMHGTCTLDYYSDAMNYFESRFTDITYCLFSDDVDWSLENLVFNYPVISSNASDISDTEDMFLMSQCDHHIIANSSFSWWGAWLNRNEHKKVVAPDKWFASGCNSTTDLLPESWVKM